MDACLFHDANINTLGDSLHDFEQNEKKIVEITNNSVISVESLPFYSLEDKISFKSSISNIEKLLNCVLSNDQLNNNIISRYETKTNTQDLNSTDLSFMINEYRSEFLSIVSLEKILENEINKRQHSEKQIMDLNEKNLELQKQLALLKGLEKKYLCFIKKIEFSLKQVSYKFFLF